MGMDLEKMAPDGWKFMSADFSIQAHTDNPDTPGGVLLIRDLENRTLWHDRLKEVVAMAQDQAVELDIDEVQTDEIPLYIIGRGINIVEALTDAWDQAVKFQPIGEMSTETILTQSVNRANALKLK
jgi:hypothetical protein